jgi:HPt (histidine-containing phosphotransfer) domain-containing protein
MTQDVIDLSVYGDLKDATGAEFAGELVQTFLDEMPGMIADLKTAVQAGDADGFRRAAHSIKSNANVFGASGLAERARQLELEGFGAAAQDNVDRVEALDKAFTDVRVALKALQDG